MPFGFVVQKPRKIKRGCLGKNSVKIIMVGSWEMNLWLCSPNGLGGDLRQIMKRLIEWEAGQLEWERYSDYLLLTEDRWVARMGY